MGSLNDLYAERDRLNQQIATAEKHRALDRQAGEDALYDLLNTTPEFTKTERKGSAGSWTIFSSPSPSLLLT